MLATTTSSSTIERTASASPTRLSVIDTAKGVGIALVVFGHMVAREAKPRDNEWWMVFHDHLYSFHMAFFFFLSGYVFFLKPADQWPAALRKTASKLIPAYVLFALIVYAAKFAAARYLHVDRPVQDPLGEILSTLTYPTDSFAQFLWFIVTLLMIYSLATALRGLITRHFVLTLAAALCLHLLSVNDQVTKLFALHQLARYLLFFLIGGACHRWVTGWTVMTSRLGVVTFSAFLAALIWLPPEWLPTVAGLLSVPALTSLARWLDRYEPLREPLQFLGRNTLTIYLMNSLAMGLVRGIVLKVWDWDGWHFFVVAPLLLSAGLILPIVTQRLLFSRWKWTDRITR